MAERSLYYWSKMYSEQLEKGAEYKKLKKAIAINLLAFDYLEDEQDWHNNYKLLNLKSHKKLTDHIEIHFLELPKFTLKDMRKIRVSEAWIAYFSGKYSKKELEEIAMKTPAIKEAVEFEDTFLQDYSYMNSYKEEGIEEGIKEGIEKVVINGLKEGININIISQITKLSIKDIEKIKVKLNL